MSTRHGPTLIVTSCCFQLVYAVLNLAGADQRQDDLFSDETLLAKGRNALKGRKVEIGRASCRERVYLAV